MEQFLYTLLVVFGIILVAFFLINVRQIFTGKEFRGTCSANNAFVRDPIGKCTVCGSEKGEECKGESSGKVR